MLRSVLLAKGVEVPKRMPINTMAKKVVDAWDGTVGIEVENMTKKGLASVLRRHHIQQLELCLGDKYDPTVAEAVAQVAPAAAKGAPAGTIWQVLQDGYMIHDRILRPARVVVVEGTPKPVAQSWRDSPSMRSHWGVW